MHRPIPDASPNPPTHSWIHRSRWLAVLLLAVLPLAGAQEAQEAPEAAVATTSDPLLWPEEQRAFFQDGPALLLPEADREAFAAMDDLGRETFLQRFLSQDPLPETPENELAQGIQRRRLLVRSQGLSPQDDRARLLFLHGPPRERQIIDCGTAFRPLELWGYEDPALAALQKGFKGDESTLGRLVLYLPAAAATYRLWLPLDSKRVLYTPELEYFLEQWEELRGFIRGRRFDYQLCPDARIVDGVTGVSALFGFKENRPTNSDFQHYLDPPDGLARWARQAAATELPEMPEELEITSFEIQFPERQSQRMVARLTVRLPADGNFESAVRPSGDGAFPGRPGDAAAAPASTPEAAAESAPTPQAPAASEVGETAEADGEQRELDLSMEGLFEKDGKVFDTFRVRFTPEVTDEPKPVALVVERLLRPERSFLLRLRVRDEVSGAETFLNRGFSVPEEPEPIELAEMPQDAIVAIGETVAQQPMAGADSLVLVPPETDVILGLWRAEALVTGERIARVVFLVDGQQQLARSRRPFTAEVRLAKYPTEQVVRAEGYDEKGELVDSDEVVINQPRGALRVRIVEPTRGARVSGTTTARAEIVVPEGRRIRQVSFLVNGEPVAALERPPWETEVEVPASDELAYLTVVAELDDESRAEDVRFFNSPEFLEEVDVSLVELFTTVTDRSGRLARGLTAADFEILEDGKPQELVKFELVEDLPLTIGITIDTSGSMAQSLVEAQRAATDFLSNVVTRKDRCFAIGFSDRPVMLMPPTDDVDAVALALQDLKAYGYTSLYDAVVHSLYYFRGVRGRRALILLSDGEDTTSNLSYRDSLEYARRSGVAIYTIGLGVSGLDINLRDKLKSLSDETGGRHFFIKNADELRGVYQEIEDELRSQYLLAYGSNQSGQDGSFRTVEVKVKQRGLDARTVRGYYQ